MSDERKIFPMETALGVLANEEGEDVLGFMSFAAQRDVCECCRPVVSPVVRGWLMSLQPEFVGATSDPSFGTPVWVAQYKDRLGDNISVPAMPESEVASLAAVLDSLQAMVQTAEAKTVEAAEAVATVKKLEPFKAKAEKLEAAKVALEDKVKALTEEVAKLKKDAAAYVGKVAIDQVGLEKSVTDMVASAVKEALAKLPVGVAGAAVAGEAAAEGSAPAEEAGGGVPDTFGFGTSGASDDGFGF